MYISVKIAEKNTKDDRYMNLEPVAIRNEILIYRNLSILNSISRHVNTD